MSEIPTQTWRNSVAREDMIVTKWGARFQGRRIPCAIGRGGISAIKAEGDGVSPAGLWRIVGGGFRRDRVGKPKTSVHLRPVLPRDIWSDDVKDPNYNKGLRAFGYRFSHETLRRSDPLYDVVLWTDWNWPDPARGKGSAIFVHHWRTPRYPTAGCIAFAPKDLRWIMERWKPQTRIFVR